MSKAREEASIIPRGNQPIREGKKIMLMSIAIILLLLWALGLVTSATLGGFIHILLVIAVVMVLIRLIQGRRL